MKYILPLYFTVFAKFIWNNPAFVMTNDISPVYLRLYICVKLFLYLIYYLYGWGFIDWDTISLGPP